MTTFHYTEKTKEFDKLTDMNIFGPTSLLRSVNSIRHWADTKPPQKLWKSFSLFSTFVKSWIPFDLTQKEFQTNGKVRSKCFTIQQDAVSVAHFNMCFMQILVAHEIQFWIHFTSLVCYLNLKTYMYLITICCLLRAIKYQLICGITWVWIRN